MDRTIIFNHIPRTGGTTLRVILNKVYGESRVFFINSTDIAASLSAFTAYSNKERERYRVIAGHGALQFRPLVQNAYTISILREPLELFMSQYYYLRKSPDSNFLNEVSALESFDAYQNYALEKGQDNMMVRCLDPENKQFIDSSLPPPRMDGEGKAMLRRAMEEIERNDAVIVLTAFDTGVFSLSRQLSWPRIPLYRPLNKASYNRSKNADMQKMNDKLQHLLRFDIELYNTFGMDNSRYDSASIKKGVRYHTFIARQKLISFFLK